MRGFPHKADQYFESIFTNSDTFDGHITVKLHLLHDSWLSPLRHWLSADSSLGMVGDRLDAPPPPAFCMPATAVPASFAVYRFASSCPLLTFFLKRMRLLPNQFDTWNTPQLNINVPLLAGLHSPSRSQSASDSANGWHFALLKV